MNNYIDRSGRSGIDKYEFVNDGVNVQFKGGSQYFYPIDGNDTATMTQLHALLDHGEYANRLINSSKPAYRTGRVLNKESEPVGDKRTLVPDNNTKVKSITNRFLSRMKPIADKLRTARDTAMKAAGDFKSWLTARK